MIIDGERIKELVKGARKEVIFCAPFIKAKALSLVLSAVPQTTPVRIITRWRPAEVAAGLSDLEIFDIAKERAHTDLALLDALHAKLYLADDDCLVGSANLTGAALGWSQNPNVEILHPARRSDPEVERLLERLATATPATFQIRSDIEKKAAAIDSPALPEAQDVPSAIIEHGSAPWLPRCAAPDKLFAVYENPETTVVVEGTRADALADLNDLLPPQGLGHEAFTTYISHALYEFPAFRQILNSIPGRLTDLQATAIVADLRPGLSESDLLKQWQIVREWIGEFFKDRFEVAPESYVVRLKSH